MTVSRRLPEPNNLKTIEDIQNYLFDLGKALGDSHKATPTNIKKLSDVSVGLPLSGQVLTWNSTIKRWTNAQTSINFNSVASVSVGTVVSGNILLYREGQWTAVPHGYGQIEATSVGTIVSGYFLRLVAGATKVSFENFDDTVFFRTGTSLGNATAPIGNFAANLRTATGNDTLVSTDSGGVILADFGASANITLPAMKTGFHTTVIQVSSGNVVFVKSGTSLLNYDGHSKLAGRGAAATLVVWRTNEYVLAGRTSS